MIFFLSHLCQSQILLFDLLSQKDEDGKEAKPAAQQQDKVLFTLVNGQVGILIGIRFRVFNLAAGDEDGKCTGQPDSWGQANADRACKAADARGGRRGKAVQETEEEIGFEGGSLSFFSSNFIFIFQGERGFGFSVKQPFHTKGSSPCSTISAG